MEHSLWNYDNRNRTDEYFIDVLFVVYVSHSHDVRDNIRHIYECNESTGFSLFLCQDKLKSII